MKIEELGPEAKYSPAFFVNDFTALTAVFREKARLISQLEFSDIQKAQISGTLMTLGISLNTFVDELKKWGMIP